MFTHYFKVGLGIILSIIILYVSYTQVQEFKMTKDNSYALYVVFDNVEGLSVGNAVWLSGIKIGKVEQLDLRDDGRAELALRIENQYKIHKGSQFSIKVGVLEDKTLSIEKPEGLKPPYEFYEPEERIEDTRSPSTIADLTENANRALEEITAILKNVREMVESEQLKGNIFETTENIKLTTAEAYKFLEILKETGVRNRDDIDATVGNVRTITENLVATAEKLDQLVAHVDTLLTHAEDVMGDELFKANIKGAVADVKTSMSQVEEVTRSIRDLVTDEEINEDLKETIKSTRSTMENADKAVSSFTRMLRAINETEFRPDFEFRYETKARDYFADMNIRIFPPSSEVYYLFGFDDIGEESSTNLQFGIKGKQPNQWYRFGIKSGKLGGGMEFLKKENLFYEAELSDPNDIQLNFRVGRGISPNQFVIVGWERILNGDSLSIGFLGRY